MNLLGAFWLETDPKVARAWFKRAAVAGNSEAMANLGFLLQATDPNGSSAWYKRAAEAGDVDAMFQFALSVEETHRSEAQTWYRRAADAGHTDAMNSLGNLLVKADFEEARAWWEQAAQAGNRACNGEPCPLACGRRSQCGACVVRGSRQDGRPGTDRGTRLSEAREVGRESPEGYGRAAGN
jgi:TPR repeat protein